MAFALGQRELETIAEHYTEKLEDEVMKIKAKFPNRG